MNSISLSELTDRIEQTIKLRFDTPIWVRAEISEMRVNNGHCFLELIEKAADSDNITAKMRAVVWNNTFRMLRPYFENETGETWRAGLKVLIAVVVDFSGAYGISLNVRDIDPVFTMGELAVRRLQIIRRLEQEGVADMNKELSMPLLPQRLAIISSVAAAGYDDFCNQLRTNRAGFAFYPKLFPAIMQGAQAETSIVQALERIYEHIDLFDAVVIVRGGGAATDLSCFDSYDLALNCAQFPLPIIAGIGHQRDVSIVDMVAHSSVKTPTAAAELLLSVMNEALDGVRRLAARLTDGVYDRLYSEQQAVQRLELMLRQAVKAGWAQESNHINNVVFRLKNLLHNRMEKEKNQLSLMQAKVDMCSPKYLFERGYTITTRNGRRLTSHTEVLPGDRIVTHFSDGSLESDVV